MRCEGSGDYGRIEWQDEADVWVTACDYCEHAIPIGDDSAMVAHDTTGRKL